VGASCKRLLGSSRSGRFEVRNRELLEKRGQASLVKSTLGDRDHGVVEEVVRIGHAARIEQVTSDPSPPHVPPLSSGRSRKPSAVRRRRASPCTSPRARGRTVQLTTRCGRLSSTACWAALAVWAAGMLSQYRWPRVWTWPLHRVKGQRCPSPMRPVRTRHLRHRRSTSSSLLPCWQGPEPQ
jgi:hypothetical protein